jgi:hypothetical protein
MLLAAAAAAGLGIAAVQVLPTWEWTRTSERAAFDHPRNLGEAVWLLATPHDATDPSLSYLQSIRRGLFGKPESGTHDAEIYFYSVGPWRWAEWLFPNVFGRMFPLNQRWLSALPAEGAVWTPTLYCGLLPVLLAAAAWRWRGAAELDQWTWLLIAVGILASLGWYGLGWLWDEIAAAVTPGHESGVGKPVGGVYWLLVVLLPGYVYLRYPAKWLTVAMWGISFLAGRAASELDASDKGGTPSGSEAGRLRRRLCRLALAMATVSLVLAAGAVLARPRMLESLSAAPANDTFGPLDGAGAWWSLFLALVHAAAVSLLGWMVLCTAPFRRLVPPSTWLLFITAADVLIANHWLLLSVPARELEAVSSVAAMLAGGDALQRVVHDASGRTAPPTWRRTGDRDRLVEVVAWERDALLHKHHLPRGINVVDSASTINSAEAATLLGLARAAPLASGASPSLWTMLGVGHVVAWDDHGIRPHDTPDPSAVRRAEQVQTGIRPIVRGLPDSLPRVWLVHDWEPEPELKARTRQAIERHLRQLWLHADGITARDPRHKVSVGGESKLPPPDLPGRGEAAAGESALIVGYAPQRIETIVTLQAPGIVVLGDAFHPGWFADVRLDGGASRTVEVSRVNGVLRGVYLPAGRHQLTFCFRSRSFLLGGILSLVATALVVAVAAGTKGRKRQKGQTGQSESG